MRNQATSTISTERQHISHIYKISKLTKNTSFSFLQQVQLKPARWPSG